MFEYDFDMLVNCLCELVFLNCGIKIMIEDKCEEDKRCEYYYEGGIKFYVEYLNCVKEVIYEELIYIEGNWDNIFVEIVI